MEKRTFTYVALALLVWAISGTIVAGYYFAQYNIYQNEYENLASELNTLYGTVGDLPNTLSDTIEDLSETLSGAIGDLSENFTGELNTLSDTVRNLSEIMESISLKVNILVSYGNETKIWYNNTALPLGSTAFTAILAIADIKYTDYGGDLGILVTSINGLASNSTYGWLYWYWDADTSEWILPTYSCAKYILHRGDTIAFAYESYMTWPPPTPT